MTELTRRQQRFVAEYLIDLNGAAAARRVGCSETSARAAAARFLRRPGVRAAVETETARARAACGLRVQAVLGELARVAFFDPGKLYDEWGNPLPMRALDAATRAGLGQIELIETEATATKPARRVMRMKPGQKVRALTELAKRLIPLEDAAAARGGEEWVKSLVRSRGFVNWVDDKMEYRGVSYSTETGKKGRGR